MPDEGGRSTGLWDSVALSARALVERVAAMRAAIVEDAMDLVLTLPYGEAFESGAFGDVWQHCRRHLDAFLVAAGAGRLPDQAELPFVVEMARRHACDGLDPRPMLEAYGMWSRVVSHWINQIGMESAEPPETTLALVTALVEFSLHASGLWIESYMAGARRSEDDAGAIAQTVIEDLMTGDPGYRHELRARRAGLEPAAANHVVLLAASELTAATTAARRQLIMRR